MENDIYTFSRCGYNAKLKHHLVNHLKRKNECDCILSNISREEILKSFDKIYNEKTYDCEFCGRKFNSSGNKSKHKNLCKKKNDIIQRNNNEIQYNNTQNNNITNNTTINNINNGVVNNITINAFGKENIDYMFNHPNYLNFMKKCLRNNASGILEYLEKKHFNENCPENLNIKKLVKKDNFIETYDGKKWLLRLSQEVIEELFENIENDFTDFINEYVDKDGGIKQHLVDNFMRKIGYTLDWSIEYDDYGDDTDELKKSKQKIEIYKLAIEYIYRKSKEKYN